MADEVHVFVEQLRHILGVAREVDPTLSRATAEAAAIDEQKPKGVGERPLLPPRRLAPTEATVDEHCGIAFTQGRDVQLDGAMHAPRLTRASG